MAKNIKFIKFDEYFDEKLTLTVSEGFKKNEFHPKGIYSEEIFGGYYDDNNDISKKAWIKLNHPLINPILYFIMKEKKIIKDEDSKNIINIIETLSKNPSEFLDSRRTSKNTDIINFIINNNECLLINSYPVFTHKLRPITVIGGEKPKLIYDKVNNYFSMLIEYNNNIGENLSDKNFDNDDFIWGMQTLVYTITDFITGKVLSKKKGVLRKEVLGSRLDHTSRCVITPLVGDYSIDDCSIPYLVAVELYKYQIINMLVRIKNINYNDALRIVEEAKLNFSKEIYAILDTLKRNTKGGLKILVGRNPK